MSNPIVCYEHTKLTLSDEFQPHHLKALLKLNEFHSFNYLEAIVNGVKFKNYVGVIQVDDLIIEILPKMDKGPDDKELWRGLLLEMLDVAGKVHIYEMEEALVRKRKNHLLEIYLELFLNEVDQLLRKGLVKQYRQHTTNTLALKGKLKITKHVQKNFIHKDRFYTTHQVYDVDHKLHQILRTAINIVFKLTKTSYLASLAGRVNLLFPELIEYKVAVSTFDKILLNRKTSHYRKALELAKIIIENYSPNI